MVSKWINSSYVRLFTWVNRDIESLCVENYSNLIKLVFFAVGSRHQDVGANHYQARIGLSHAELLVSLMSLQYFVKLNEVDFYQ